jgi:hypothetical protein
MDWIWVTAFIAGMAVPGLCWLLIKSEPRVLDFILGKFDPDREDKSPFERGSNSDPDL